MLPELAPIERCAEMAGLEGHEIVLGVSPGDKHFRMFSRYRRAASLEAARGRVVADIRNAVAIGAARRAADLLIVLRWLFAPGAIRADADERAPTHSRRRTSLARLRRGWRVSGAAPAAIGGAEVVGLFDGMRPARG